MRSVGVNISANHAQPALSLTDDPPRPEWAGFVAQVLRGLPQLTGADLAFPPAPPAAVFAALAAATGLTMLALHLRDVHPAVLNVQLAGPLAALTRLQILHIDGAGRVVEPRSRAEALRSTPDTDRLRIANALKPLTTLTSLKIDGWCMDPTEAGELGRALPALRKLQSLEFEDLQLIVPGPSCAVGMRALAQGICRLTGLMQLGLKASVGDFPPDGTVATMLAHLTSLTKVDLREPRNMECLQQRLPPFSADSLEGVERLTRLVHLDVSGHIVETSDAPRIGACIAKLANLRTLKACNCPCSDSVAEIVASADWPAQPETAERLALCVTEQRTATSSRARVAIRARIP